MRNLKSAEGYGRRNQRRLANKPLLARRNFSKARDLKLSTTGARFPFRTAIPISDIGILSAISQAATEATLRLTADAGRMATPMPESTSEISVGISPAVSRTLGLIPAPLSIPKLRQGK